MNVMREIRVGCITLNIGCAGNAERIERAKKLLEKIAGRKAVVTRSRRRSTFGLAKGVPVGVKVTLRKQEAEEFLKLALAAKHYKLKASQFDEQGNFSIGIKEYIDLPGVKYDPSIGMFGMDVCITLERPGFRLKRKRIRRGKVGKVHRITKAEAMEWVQRRYGVQIA